MYYPVSILTTYSLVYRPAAGYKIIIVFLVYTVILYYRVKLFVDRE